MFQGKVKAALQLLRNESDSKGGMLPLNSKLPTGLTVREELICKHPIGQPIHPSAVLSFPTSKLPSHPVIFDSLEGASIRTAALHTNGSAGPSGLDALGWRSLCTSFQYASTDLCNSLALVARKICTLMLTLKVLQHLLPTILLPLINVQECAPLVLVR